MPVSPPLTGLTSPPAASFLASLVEQQLTGQVLVRQSSPAALSWRLFLSQGKLNFVTSDRSQPDRMRYLIGRYNPALQPLPYSPELSDYDYLCQHWQQGKISLVQAKQLLSLICLEAVVQILAQGGAEIDVQANVVPLEPILLSLNLNDLINAIQGQVGDWYYQQQFIGCLAQCPRVRDRVRVMQQLGQTYSVGLVQQFVNASEANRSFYEIALELNQDALQLARQVYPLVQQSAVELLPPEPSSALGSARSQTSTQPSPSNFSVAQPSATQPAAGRLPETKPSGVPQSFSPHSAQRDTPKTAQTHFKIACVDDSPTILQEISNCLNGSDLDFSIFPITNSVRALMWVSRIQPDLILLDVGMPGVDGYELCRMIRGNEMFQSIPIIMVTGNRGRLNQAVAMEAGASAYVTKPFTAEGLLEVVKQHLPI